MNIFQIYNKGGTLSAEWKKPNYGYCAVNWRVFRIYQRFFTKGIAELGSEKEFIFRFSAELDSEPKFSWLTVELFNTFEGRIVYIWVKLWKDYTLDLSLNFGFRVSKASRLALTRMRQRQEVERIKEMNQIKNQVGGSISWPRAVQVPLKVMK